MTDRRPQLARNVASPGKVVDGVKSADGGVRSVRASDRLLEFIDGAFENRVQSLDGLPLSSGIRRVIRHY